jgi:hypothetical protein
MSAGMRTPSAGKTGHTTDPDPDNLKQSVARTLWPNAIRGAASDRYRQHHSDSTPGFSPPRCLAALNSRSPSRSTPPRIAAGP